MTSTYCKRCGAMIEADLSIDGYGVRCGCAGEEYRKLQAKIASLQMRLDISRKLNGDFMHENAENVQKLTDLRKRIREAYKEMMQIDRHNVRIGDIASAMNRRLPELEDK